MSKLQSTIRIGSRSVDVGLTLADKVVNWLSPTAGQKRYHARARMALLGGGGYTSADKSRAANKLGGKREMDADSAILPDLITLREESQHLSRNNPLASASLKTNVTKVVGSGLQVKSKVDRKVLNLTDEQADDWEKAAEREYKLATETREIDAERELPFSILQGLAFLRVLEDGDVLVNFPRFSRSGSPYKLKLQVIEAARLCNPDFKPDTDTLIAGVQKDGYGAAEKFHVVNRHPGNLRHHLLRNRKKEFSWQPLDAFAKDGTPKALHLKDKTRPGQTRGVPYLAPVIELIKQLGKYTDAEVMAAVVSGMMTVFVYNESGIPEFNTTADFDNPTGEQSPLLQETDIAIGAGTAIGVRNGSKIEIPDPPRPNPTFDPFFIAITRQIGMALEIPFEVLTKHFTSSYSAARAALEDAWDYFLRRRHWLASQLCQPVYEAVITEAVIYGRLAAPGYLSDPLIRKAWLGTLWIGEAKNQIDELKEVKAARERIDAKLTTISEERTKLVGGDWESVQPELVKEDKWLKENDLKTETKSSANTPAEPEEKENETV